MNLLRRPATVLALTLLSGLASGGCSADDTTSSQPKPRLTTSAAPTRVVYPPAPLPPLPATGVRVEYREAPWIRDTRTGSDTLVIFTMDSSDVSCTRFDHADVYETDESVTVRTFQRNVAPIGPNTGCPAIGLAAAPITIPLNTPLGDRRPIGACDDLTAATPPPAAPLAPGCQALHESAQRFNSPTPGATN